MTRVNVAKLKSQLSSYLRRTREGERFLVMDRNEPVAELTPTRTPEDDGWLHRLAADGQVRLPAGALSDVVVTPLSTGVQIQDLITADRDER